MHGLFDKFVDLGFGGTVLVRHSSKDSVAIGIETIGLAFGLNEVKCGQDVARWVFLAVHDRKSETGCTAGEVIWVLGFDTGPPLLCQRIVAG